jgi:hypothetical protein
LLCKIVSGFGVDKLAASRKNLTEENKTRLVGCFDAIKILVSGCDETPHSNLSRNLKKSNKNKAMCLFKGGAGDEARTSIEFK